MKTNAITMTGIILAVVGSINSWALVVYWHCFHNQWEQADPIVGGIGFVSMVAALLLGCMLVRENRVIGWIAIGSGGLCFFIIGLFSPQL